MASASEAGAARLTSFFSEPFFSETPVMKLLSRLLKSKSSTQACREPAMAPLESRVLLAAAPYVLNTISDNRGEVVFQMSRSVVASTVNNTSVQMHTAGVDGL